MNRVSGSPLEVGLPLVLVHSTLIADVGGLTPLNDRKRTMTNVVYHRALPTYSSLVENVEGLRNF